MTKKHFKAIAAILKTNRQLMARLKNGNKANDASLDHIHSELIREFATACSEWNPNFNRAKFLEACGVE